MDPRKKLAWIAGVFGVAFFLPMESDRLRTALVQAFVLLQEYAREHVLTCLIPAFFIAGAISIFISKGTVMKYFGARANKLLSYSVASVSGMILAVCSCTVMPLFAGLYTRGAGIGPATAFLYSGPAINVLAIIFTARILDPSLGLARAVGAVTFAALIGLIMAALFPRREGDEDEDFAGGEEAGERSLGQTIVYFATMILILIFATWAKPKVAWSFWAFIYSIHWFLVAALGLFLAWMLTQWFRKTELQEWVQATREFMLQIFPLLFAGVLIAGLLMGSSGQDNGLIPNRYIEMLVGGNSVRANFFAALSGALMYFATLTEVPILQGLLASGMGKGPALALLLAGPTLSLPSILVIRSIMGTKRTLVYVVLVVTLATLTGMIFGTFWG